MQVPKNLNQRRATSHNFSLLNILLQRVMDCSSKPILIHSAEEKKYFIHQSGQNKDKIT